MEHEDLNSKKQEQGTNYEERKVPEEMRFNMHPDKRSGVTMRYTFYTTHFSQLIAEKVGINSEDPLKVGRTYVEPLMLSDRFP